MTTSPSLPLALDAATEAVQAAGQLMRRHFRSPKKINEATRHDLKLELDVRCQTRIERILRHAFPLLPILGEEGVTGNPEADWRWVVDPIDGTVNFAHEIPHCCSTVALQRRRGAPNRVAPDGHAYQTVLGVIFDPFCNELWTAQEGRASRLNGRVIHVSQRARLAETIVAIGFAKDKSTLRRMVPAWDHLIHRVRKIRIMGAAALGLAYVASGRLDAYLEFGLRLWDVAAGGLLIEGAGGRFWNRPLESPYRYHIIASNGHLDRALARFR